MDFTQLYVMAAEGSITGSIQRICAVHHTNGTTVDNWVTGTFKKLTYDDGTEAAHTGSQNDVHQIGTTSFEVPVGGCVDGPFIAVGTDDSNGLLVYYLPGTLIQVDD